MKKTKLNIGCGPDKRKDYINIDINSKWNPDVLDDARTLEKIEDNSVDEIIAFNFLEHLPQYEIKQVLELWCKKLNNKGKLLILVPDLKVFSVLYACGMIKEPWAFQALYSSSKSSNPVDWHKSGFSEQYLGNLLVDVGFKESYRFFEKPFTKINCLLLMVGTKYHLSDKEKKKINFILPEYLIK